MPGSVSLKPVARVRCFRTNFANGGTAGQRAPGIPAPSMIEENFEQSSRDHAAMTEAVWWGL